MLSKIYNKLHKNHFILKIKLLLKSIGVGSYLNNKILGTEDDYLQIFKNAIYGKNNFLNLEESEITFINNLALITQVTKKTSKINFDHGFLIYQYLKDYLINHVNEKIIILETGTGRGFSSIIMASLLSSHKIKSEIHTIDIIPHQKKMYWNCISDPRNGKVTREELLKDYKEYLKFINFHEGTARDVFKNFSLDRINFSFLDGAHDYIDIKLEYEYVKSKNIKGDIIFIDDYTPLAFDGIVKLVNEAKEEGLYEVNCITSSPPNTGYAILTRK
tara:strand:+ start:125 stop:946 length:822 start_codon:yes stop_codon:yes gene_type:complete